MARIIIIGEGQTEQAFCNDVLQPYFNPRGIYIQNPVIKKTMGGIANWEALKHQIETHLRQDTTAFVSTLIDYYAIYPHHQYPGWVRAELLANKIACMENLENGMYNDIHANLQRRFIPYIQLHEFEGLLFSDIRVFDNSFEPDEFLDYDYLRETIDEHDNPEMINKGNLTAPSKRLDRIIRGYRKVIHGSLLAHDIGLMTIRAKCQRFNSWIMKLENVNEEARNP
jgi:hypothetical protein